MLSGGPAMLPLVPALSPDLLVEATPTWGSSLLVKTWMVDSFPGFRVLETLQKSTRGQASCSQKNQSPCCNPKIPSPSPSRGSLGLALQPRKE